MDANVVYLNKLHFYSSDGQRVRFLTAPEIAELLKVSRATAYRIMKTGNLTHLQREMLELKLFGLIPGWDGWRIEGKNIIDPTGYKYSEYDIMSIPLLKSISRNS